MRGGDENHHVLHGVVDVRGRDGAAETPTLFTGAGGGLAVTSFPDRIEDALRNAPWHDHIVSNYTGDAAEDSPLFEGCCWRGYNGKGIHEVATVGRIIVERLCGRSGGGGANGLNDAEELVDLFEPEQRVGASRREIRER